MRNWIQRVNAANWKWIFWLNYCSTAIICILKIASCAFCCQLPSSLSQSFFFLSWYQCIFIWLWAASKIIFNCLKLVFLVIFYLQFANERLNQCRQMGEISLWLVFGFVQPYFIPLAFRLIEFVFTIRMESNTSMLATDRRHAHCCQLILYHPLRASDSSLNLAIYTHVNLSICLDYDFNYMVEKREKWHQSSMPHHAPKNKNKSSIENNSSKQQNTETCVVVFCSFISNLLTYFMINRLISTDYSIKNFHATQNSLIICEIV